MIINNRYQLIKKLGEGGMGYVFLAKDIYKGGLEIALKTLKISLATDPQKAKDSTDSLKHEFELMSALKHPNLARVYEFGRITATNSNTAADPQIDVFENGDLFLAMEYITGKNLREYLNSNPKIRISIIMDIMVTLLRTLDFIHSRNICYHDLKPENLIVEFSQEGDLTNLKLLDFGLADQIINSHAQVKGTVSYMAPEVLKGKADRKADIFSAGIIFFELLNGSLFYSDSSVSSIILALNSEIAFSKFIKIDEIHDANLRKIIAKMTAFDLSERFNSAAEIIKTINNITVPLLPNVVYPIETLKTVEAYVLGAPFCDRDYEIEQLKGILKDNLKKIAVVTGDLGVGKTRLFEEFKIFCQTKNIQMYTAVCSQSSSQGSFMQLIDQMLYLANDKLIAKYGKELKKLLPMHTTLSKIKSEKSLDDLPEKNLIIQTVTNFLIDFAVMGAKTYSIPRTCIWLDNCQNADELALEILNELSFKISSYDKFNGECFLRVFVSTRNEGCIAEIISALTAKERIVLLKLSNFSLQQTEKYISNIFGDQLDSSLIESVPDIYSICDGNVLFLEQLLQYMVLNQFIVRKTVNWQLTKSIRELHSLDSVHDIIESKLDRLALNDQQKTALNLLVLSSKQNLTIDSFQLLCRGYCSIDIKVFFNYLLENEILFLKNDNYNFISKLISDVIKDNIPAETNIRLNEHISNRLEEIYFSLTNDLEKFKDDEIDSLSYHYGNTENYQKALFYSKLNAKRHAEKFHNKKALELYSKIIELHKICGIEKELDEVYFEIMKIQRILGFNQKAVDSGKIALEIAESNKNFKLMIQIYFTLGFIYNEIYEFGIAFDCVESVKKLLTADKNDLLQLYTLTGTIYLNSGKPLAAFEMFEEYLKLSYELDLPKNICIGLGNFGSYYMLKSDLDKALGYYDQLLTLSRNYGFKRFLSIALNALGIIYSGRDKKLSEKYYKESIEIADEIGDKTLYIRTILNFLSTPKGSQNIKLMEKVIRTAREQDNKQIICVALGNIGSLLIRDEKFDKALEYILEYLKISEEIDYKRGLAIGYRNISFVYLATKKDDLYRNALEKSVQYSRETGNNVILCDALIVLAQHCLQTNKYADALSAAEESLQVAENIKNALIQVRSKTILLCLQFINSDSEILKNNLYLEITELIAANKDCECVLSYYLYITLKNTGWNNGKLNLIDLKSRLLKLCKIVQESEHKQLEVAQIIADLES